MNKLPPTFCEALARLKGSLRQMGHCLIHLHKPSVVQVVAGPHSDSYDTLEISCASCGRVFWRDEQLIKWHEGEK
jgi:uncharacterized protein with PIN domain